MHSSLAITCVSGEKMCQAKGGSFQKIEGLLPTSARDDNEKGATICSVTSRRADYVKT
jgi:hypothetical protein